MKKGYHRGAYPSIRLAEWVDAAPRIGERRKDGWIAAPDTWGGVGEADFGIAILKRA